MKRPDDALSGSLLSLPSRSLHSHSFSSQAPFHHVSRPLHGIEELLSQMRTARIWKNGQSHALKLIVYNGNLEGHIGRCSLAIPFPSHLLPENKFITEGLDFFSGSALLNVNWSKSKSSSFFRLNFFCPCFMLWID
mmetsp:Transcript_3616/g.13814  ORF Transcript_3616/g.13814 Transcript_3616/m.13814 type:complete len:136 (-) Transcript_3616:1300-1707(-)